MIRWPSELKGSCRALERNNGFLRVSSAFEAGRPGCGTQFPSLTSQGVTLGGFPPCAGLPSPRLSNEHDSVCVARWQWGLSEPQGTRLWVSRSLSSHFQQKWQDSRAERAPTCRSGRKRKESLRTRKSLRTGMLPTVLCHALSLQLCSKARLSACLQRTARAPRPAQPSPEQPPLPVPPRRLLGGHKQSQGTSVCGHISLRLLSLF